MSRVVNMNELHLFSHTVCYKYPIVIVSSSSKDSKINVELL